MNARDLSAFVQYLHPDVRLISKWWHANGPAEVRSWLERTFQATTADSPAWRIGTKDVDGKLVPLAYTRGAGGDDVGSAFGFGLADGAIDAVCQLPGHYYRRSGDILWDPMGSAPLALLSEHAHFVVTLGPAMAGWIAVTICCFGEEHICVAHDCTDPFPSLLTFLEAITLGVDEAGVRWWGDGLLNLWACCFEDGSLRFKIRHASDDSRQLDVTLPRREFVATLYHAVRNYARSGDFEPSQWAPLTVRDCIADTIPDAPDDEARVATAATWPAEKLDQVCRWHQGASDDAAKELTALRDRLRSARGVPSAEGQSMVPADWPSRSVEARMRSIHNALDKPVSFAEGSDLRKWRSELVEAYLAQPT
jgi:hypothetical protein